MTIIKNNMARVFVLLALLLVAFVSPGALAFPFAASSGVKELTPSSLKAFTQTHKPVVILFYAPWCGHCKAFHADYERFAQLVKGTVRVGAINADAHSQVAQQFGVRGFPTIKYWPMGLKSSPTDYQQARTAAALQAFVMNNVLSDKVLTNITTADQLTELVRSSPNGKVSVLFSSKKKVPPIFSVLSYSAKLQSMPFVFVGEQHSSVVGKAFHVESFPAVVALTKAADADAEAEGKGVKVVPFTKEQISYEPLAKFFLSCLESPQCDSAEGAGDATFAGDQGGDSNADGGARKGTLAFPVAPVVLTPLTLEQYCSPAAAKVGGQTPLCVFSLAQSIKLDSMKELFANEAITFVDASSSAAEEGPALLAKLFRELGAPILSGGEGQERSTIVLLRHNKKDKLRYAEARVQNNDELNTLLQSVLTGEFPLKTQKLD